MSFSTLCHIYLNYNYDELSSRWIHSSFARHLQFATRMLISFLIGGFITYGTELHNQLSLAFMLTKMNVSLIIV